MRLSASLSRFNEAVERCINWEITMNRTEWEDRVTDLLADELEITRSDAQAIMEANEDLVDAQWAAQATPETATAAVSLA